MKISKLYAENVHGFLPIEVSFFDDLTFLCGLNGTGKTSALRLLMALLSPNIAELAAISFSLAEVTVVDNLVEIKVTAIKGRDGLQLAISSIAEHLFIATSEMEIFLESKRSEERPIQMRDMYRSNNVFSAISKISTPMFLGLDRRFFVPGAFSDDIDEVRRRQFLGRKYLLDDPTVYGTAAATGLLEVNYLVVNRTQEIRVSQENLDNNLREEFITKAFEYKPADIYGKQNLPSRQEVEQYRKQISKIEQAAAGISIPLPQIQSLLAGFIEKMSVVVESIEKRSRPSVIPKKNKKRADEMQASARRLDAVDVEWIINRPQADRILEHLKLLNTYIEDRNSLKDPITRFHTLVNGFFEQTNKELQIATNGQLSVLVNKNPEPRPITALSSGERQLLIMLAHLSLNPNLEGSGVFIVDEPELSLHIDWQEKFVEAIEKANPHVQIILATHSPAIILDRDQACKTLNEVVNA